MIMGASSSRLRNLLSNFQWTVVFPGHIIMIVLVMVVIMQTASCQRALFISHCSQPYCFEVNRCRVMSIQGTERSSTPRKSSPCHSLLECQRFARGQGCQRDPSPPSSTSLPAALLGPVNKWTICPGQCQHFPVLGPALVPSTGPRRGWRSAVGLRSFWLAAS